MLGNQLVAVEEQPAEALLGKHSKVTVADRRTRLMTLVGAMTTTSERATDSAVRALEITDHVVLEHRKGVVGVWHGSGFVVHPDDMIRGMAWDCRTQSVCGK